MLSFFQEWQPFWVAVNVFVTGFLTICVALLAREQNHLARTQAKIDAQGRRLDLYDSIMAFLANITITGTTDAEELRLMLRATRHAIFLFPKKARIVELIDELYAKGLELEYCEKEIVSMMRDEMQETRKERIIKSRKLKEWFSGKRTEIIDQFLPYLTIDEK